MRPPNRPVFRHFWPLFVAGLFACASAHAANDWVSTATYRPGSTQVSNSLCYSDGRDITCSGAGGLLTASGTLSIPNISTTAISATGNISANAFIGDGSGLTGVTAAGSDRIISGTTLVVANANTGYVSFTSGGTTTGYYSPGGIFSAVGVSTTDAISTTSLYNSGNTGLGTPPTSAALTLGGLVQFTANASPSIITTSATELRFTQTGDTYGASSLRLVNRFGSAGAIFENTGLDLVDFGFLANSGKQNNLRMEARTPYQLAGNTTGEIQFVYPDAPLIWFASGPSGTLISTPVSITGDISVTNNISAARFIGDGSGLTGVVAASGDRIVSGTTSMLAVSNTGYISVTQAGTNTAWFNPQTGLVTIGVSSTGRVSATSLYVSGPGTFTGNIATANINAANYGVSLSALQFYQSGAFNGTQITTYATTLYNLGGQPGGGYGLTLRSGESGGNSSINNIIGSINFNSDYSFGSKAAASIRAAVDGTPGATAMPGRLVFYTSPPASVTLTERMRIDSSGNVGIGVTPTTKLEVAGDISTSGNVYVTNTTGTVSGTYGYFRYISGTTIAGTFVGDGSGLTGVTAAGSDRIISGTTLVVANANTGYVSFTSNGTTTGYYSPGGIFSAVGISTTNSISATHLYSSGNARIDGNVGIGTITPSSTLHVSGSFMVSAAPSGTLYTPGLYVSGTTGMVGIGTLTPTAMLTISSSTYSGGIAINTNSLQNGNGISFNRGGGQNSYVGPTAGAAGLLIYSIESGGPVRFGTGVGNYTERMRINSIGFVGISTTAPSATLHVNGDAIITGSITGTTLVSTSDGGTVTATYVNARYISGTTIAGTFVGDGSGLTGVTAGSSDRLTSGTTVVYANGNTGYVSFTSGGVTTGYYSPGGVFSAVGISTTNAISATSIYANVGGTSGSLVFRDANGNLAAINSILISSTTGGLGIGGSPGSQGTNGLYVAGNGQVAGNLTTTAVYAGYHAIAFNLYMGGNATSQYLSFVTNNTEKMRLDTSGNLNLGSITITPTEKLTVAGNISTSGNIYVTNTTGTVSGTYGYFRYISGTTIAGTFLGDGSGLTGVTAAGSDRIISGTTIVYANSNTGYVSFTSGGVTTGYYSPGGIFSAVGISTTGTISGTDGYFSNRLATGSDANINGNLTVGSHLLLSDYKSLGWGSGIYTRIMGSSGPGSQSLTFIVSNSEAMRIVSTGNVGIGTSAPNAKLEVNGTISSTNVYAQGGTVSATNGYFRNISGTTIAGTFVGDGSGLTGVTAGSSDRLTSGTTVVYANGNTGYVSFTSGGVTTGYYSPGGVFSAVGISTTDVISTSSLYVTNRLGINTPTPETLFHLKVGGQSSGESLLVDSSYAGESSNAVFRNTSASGRAQFMLSSGTPNYGAFNANNFVGFATHGSSYSGDNYLTDSTADSGMALLWAQGSEVTRFAIGNVGAVPLVFFTNNQTKMSLTGAGDLGIGTATPAARLHVVGDAVITGSITGTTLVSTSAGGTISATNGYFRYISGTQIQGTFIGDGSGLTGVTAGSSDRLTSGTTVVYANGNTGYVSFTSGGVTTGYYSPGGVFSAVGISTTDVISATGLYLTGTTNVSASGLTIADSSGVKHAQLYPAGAASLNINMPTGGGLQVLGNGTAVFSIDTLNATTQIKTGLLIGAFIQPSTTLHVRGTALTTSWTGINFSNLTNVTPTAPLEVSGTISATNVFVTSTGGTVSATNGYFRNISGTTIAGTFVGDGSGLTGVTAGSSDRLTSGTTVVYANGNSGYVSFTSAGITTGYYSPGGVFSAVGVSTTAGISSTQGYFTSNVGIGTAPSAYLLSLGANSKGFTEYNSGGATDAIKAVANNAGAGFGVQNLSASGYSGIEYIDNGGNVAVFTGYNNGSPGEFRFNNIASGGLITFKIAGTDRLTVANNGNIGLSTASPAARLHVVGDAIITGSITGTTLVSTSAGGTVSATNGYFRNISATAFVGDGSGLTNLNAGAISGLTTDRIISTSANIVAGNGGTISFTTGGVSGTAYIDTLGRFIAAGVSTTGPISGTGLYSQGNIQASQSIFAGNGYFIGFGTTGTSIQGDSNGKYLAFLTGTSEQMRIVSTGNVGIGTSTPGAALQVSGSIIPGSDSVNNIGTSTNRYNAVYTRAFSAGANTMQINGSDLQFANGGIQVGRMTPAGLTLGTTSAATASSTLQVIGNARITSWTMINADATPTTPLEVAGIVSATQFNGKFVGDGSGLTNLAAAFVADRVVSGTTAVIANSNTGYVSFTTGGTTTGYYSPGGVFSAVGISTTGAISGTAGYFTNLLTAGNISATSALTAPTAAFGNLATVNISATGGVSVTGNVSANKFIGDGSLLTNLSLGAATLTWYNITNIPAAVANISTGLIVSTTTANAQYASFTTLFGSTLSGTSIYGGSISGTTGTFGSIGAGAIAASGNVTGSPLVSTSAGGTVSATYINARYISGTTITGTFSGDGSGLTGIIASTGDRLVSGTTSMIAVSTTGFISVTQSGTNTAWFDPTRGLVTIGISSTGTVSTTSLYVSGLSRVAGVSSTGNISANYFIGDGSLLTNINASAVTGLSTDRITSGTATLLANSNTGYISITTGNTTWGYLGSSATYLPNFGSNLVSTTGTTGTVTATVVNANTASFTTINISGTAYVSSLVVNSISATAGINPVLDSSSTTNWYSITSIPTQVQAVSNSGSINLTTLNLSPTTLTAPAATVSGALQLGATGSEACAGATNYGTLRVNPTTKHLQVCR